MSTTRLLALPVAAILTLVSLTTPAATDNRAAASAGTRNGNVLIREDGIFLRCSQCGTVESIEHNVTQGRDHGTAGAIIGAVAGGVLGNQVGKGKGRKLATVAGAVGGGFAGNKIGTGGGSESWTLSLRMSDGSYVDVAVPNIGGIHEGDLVQVDGDGNITRIQ